MNLQRTLNATLVCTPLEATHSFDPIFPVLLRDCYNHVVASAYDAGAGVGAGVEATSCLMASMYLFALIVPESHLLI